MNMIVGRNCTVGSDEIPSHRVCFPVISMMRKTIVLIWLLVQSISGIASKSWDTEFSKIVIKAVDWHILYCPPISCLEFEDLKSRQYSLTDSLAISNLMDAMKQSIEIRGNLRESIDVRCKLYFFVGDSISTTACLNESKMVYDGVFYQPSQELIRFINNLLTEELHDKDIVSPNIDLKKADDTRLKSFFEEHKQRLYKYADKPVSCFIRYRVDAQGKCLEVHANSPEGMPDKLKNEIESMLMNEFRWSLNKERLKDEFDYFSMKINISE